MSFVGASCYHSSAILTLPQEMLPQWKLSQFPLSPWVSQKKQQKAFCSTRGISLRWRISHILLLCLPEIMKEQNRERQGSRLQVELYVQKADPSWITHLSFKNGGRNQLIKPIRLQILGIKPVWTMPSFPPTLCWVNGRKAHHHFTCRIKPRVPCKRFIFLRPEHPMLMFELLPSCKLPPVVCRCVNYIFESLVAGGEPSLVFPITSPHYTNHIPHSELTASQTKGSAETQRAINSQKQQDRKRNRKLQQAASLANNKSHFKGCNKV